MTIIETDLCVLRPWRESDIDAIVPLANDDDVARYLGDRFPYPYTVQDALAWIPMQTASDMDNNLAIEVDGVLAGGIGLDPLTAEKRHASHIGYWLGKRFWGRGIATAACGGLTKHALEVRGFTRLETAVYAPNVASMRVLEKCGYVREGIMRKAIIKRGVILDAYMYAKVSE